MQFVPAVEADALIKNMKTKFLDIKGFDCVINKLSHKLYAAPAALKYLH